SPLCGLLWPETAPDHNWRLSCHFGLKLLYRPRSRFIRKSAEPFSLPRPGKLEYFFTRSRTLSIWPFPDRLAHEGRSIQVSIRRKKVKYICFGYLDVEKWGTYSQGEQNDMIDACLSYDEVLQKNGHWAGADGLGGPDSTKTLRFKNGKVSVTDGPFVESKE